MANKLQKLEDRLWNSADQLRANSELSSNEYSTPVLGLIFLKYADYKFATVCEKLGNESPDKLDVQAEGVMYLPEEARYSFILTQPEGSDIGKAINDAMKSIERENEDLKGILPKNYTSIDNQILVDLLKNFNSIDFDEGDVFGKIYEFFLGKFALAEGQGGGEFFTPTSIVKLIVEIIEPFHGKIFDPACGSGGMFVQSAEFVQAHHKSANTSISVYGEEKTAATVRLGKMNLAVHGIFGDIKQGNSYYDDIHDSVGKFDFVMANPPFNVDGIDKDRLKNDPRFPFGMPNTDNGNYLWIQSFYSALNDNGRAGFVMANSASDARSSELEIRKSIIKDKVVDVMIAVGSNMFYTVTLPCQLWFFDKGKKGSAREDKVLFVDAQHIFYQIDRTHRELTPRQIEFLANIINLYRGEAPEFINGSDELFVEYGLSTDSYQDLEGLCKVASIEEIEDKGWSLNPSRYVDAKQVTKNDIDHAAEISRLVESLSTLNVASHELEKNIEEHANRILNNLLEEGSLATEGFTKVKLRDLTELIKRGGSPKYDENGDFIVINQRCIRDQSINYANSRRSSKHVSEEKRLQYGDILINSTGVGTLGRVAQLFEHEPNLTVDSHVTIVRPKEGVNAFFLGAAVAEKQAEFERLGKGATGQTELSRDDIGDVEILLPPPELIESIAEYIEPLRHLLKNLQTREEQVSGYRDMLVPFLLSGRVKP